MAQNKKYVLVLLVLCTGWAARLLLLQGFTCAATFRGLVLSNPEPPRPSTGALALSGHARHAPGPHQHSLRPHLQRRRLRHRKRKELATLVVTGGAGPGAQAPDPRPGPFPLAPPSDGREAQELGWQGQLQLSRGVSCPLQSSPSPRTNLPLPGGTPTRQGVLPGEPQVQGLICQGGPPLAFHNLSDAQLETTPFLTSSVLGVTITVPPLGLSSY